MRHPENSVNPVLEIFQINICAWRRLKGLQDFAELLQETADLPSILRPNTMSSEDRAKCLALERVHCALQAVAFLLQHHNVVHGGSIG